MWNRLFARPQRPPARVPDGTRVYAIGDIHGRVDLLRELHAKIAADAADHAGRRVLVYLGDYIDRGIESRQTVDCLLDEPLPGFETVHLMGNHERSILDFLDDVAVGPSWLRYGGVETLFSYGVGLDRSLPAEADRLLKAQAELNRKLPPRHLAFFESLKLSHVEGDYLFVHAGIRPGVPLQDQAPDDLLWIRDEFLESAADHGKVVVHGHSIRAEPELRANRIGIDTGAYATGRLTCLRLDGADRSLLQTRL